MPPLEAVSNVLGRFGRLAAGSSFHLGTFVSGFMARRCINDNRKSGTEVIGGGRRWSGGTSAMTAWSKS